MKIVVVGAGIHGLALAWVLTRVGHAVTLLDRADIPNPLNASFDQHRLIHDFGGKASSEMPTITDAFAAWAALSRDIGSLYVETGAVRGFADAAAAAEAAQAFDTAGIDNHLLDRQSFTQALPGLHLLPGYCAIMTARGGVLLADRIATNLIGWLAARGVVIRPHSPVAAIDIRRAQAALSNGTNLQADRLLIAAGAWTAHLVPELAGMIGAKRQIMAYLKPPLHLQAAWRRSPVFVGLGRDDDLWGAPPVAGTDLKLAAGCLARPADPADLKARVINLDEQQALLARHRPYLYDIDGYDVLRMASCFYSTTATGEMLIEPLDDKRRVWVIAGCDGSDYKFAPALALMLAARVTSSF